MLRTIPNRITAGLAVCVLVTASGCGDDKPDASKKPGNAIDAGPKSLKERKDNRAGGGEMPGKSLTD